MSEEVSYEGVECGNKTTSFGGRQLFSNKKTFPTGSGQEGSSLNHHALFPYGQKIHPIF